VLGSGAIGVEFAQIYSRFGARVTVVEALDRALPAEDEDSSGEIARVLQPGGVFMYDTINRTLASKLAVIKVPQDWLKLVPPTFHVWDLFITPAELRKTLAQHGLEHRDTTGLRPGGNPLAILLGAREVKRGHVTCAEFGRRSPWVRTRSLAISYMGYAIKPA